MLVAILIVAAGWGRLTSWCDGRWCGQLALSAGALFSARKNLSITPNCFDIVGRHWQFDAVLHTRGHLAVPS